MTILIIGASGFIGNSLFQLLQEKDVIGTYLNRYKDGLIKVDMTNINELDSIFSHNKPEIVYMPAYIPGVDYCEINKESCEINKNGIRNVVDRCKTYGSKLVFFSSDYIFDGENGPYYESDSPNPINEYGKTKLKCEKMIQELDDFLIIRTTVVYGYDVESKNFLMTFVSALKKGMAKKVPIDQIGTPTYVNDLSKITIKLVENKRTGIYNVVGPDYCSRNDFAIKIARIFGLNEDLIIPVTTLELKQAARRPLKAGLLIEKIRKEINARPSGIDEALNKLKDYFK